MKNMDMREQLFAYVEKEYSVIAEYPWQGDPDSAVLRHSGNRKWFAVLLYVKRETLGLSGDGFVDILDIKAEPMLIDNLIGQDGYLRAYHMNKTKWLTVLLDGTVAFEQVCNLLDMSFDLTAGRGGKKKLRSGPMDWLIPANPKYYDVIQAFEENEIIGWKQSSDIRVGDLVYMYVGAPYSAIMFKCKAVEVNIPHYYEDENVSMKKRMQIQLLQKYDPKEFTFDFLKEYGVYAVRGPRSMPGTLKAEIEFRYGEM